MAVTGGPLENHLDKSLAVLWRCHRWATGGPPEACYQWVYLHHFNEAEEMAREVEAAFPNVVFGVAPAILKEQLEKFIRSTSPEQLMAESDAPMVGVRRATNRQWAAGTVLKRISAIKGVPLPIMRKLCESSFRCLFGHAK